MSATGIVFDIQRASLHDGPGIRTTVFLKGCPLRCAWCHNPESQRFRPEKGISGKTYGVRMSVESVMDQVLADKDYYDLSNGGMTLSGGEPTAQFAFCKELLAAAKAEGIHTCLDTCGHLQTEKLAELLPLVDLFHYDFKASDSNTHKRFTGVDNELILNNLAFLRSSGVRIILRCPQIHEVNQTAAYQTCLAEFRADDSIEAVETLPYHATGLSKYGDLGRVAPAFAAWKEVAAMPR